MSIKEILSKTYSRGEQLGYDRGYDEGRDKGYDEGFHEALERYKLVLKTLLEDIQDD